MIENIEYCIAIYPYDYQPPVYYKGFDNSKIQKTIDVDEAKHFERKQDAERIMSFIEDRCCIHEIIK
jgi:hypothetical protein